MTKVSRRSKGTQLEKELVRNFWSAINALDDRERVYFLKRILTPTEKAMLSKRLAILLELWGGSSYEEIEDGYKVITNTIARMSAVLQRSHKLPAVLKKINNTRRKKGRKRSSPRRRVSGSRTLAGTKRLLGL